jgi:hypothetical protein
MSKRLILLIGSARSGKDTFYEYTKTIEKNTIRYAFADELKNVCREKFNWDGKKDEEGRQLLITVGTYFVKGYWNYKDGDFYNYSNQKIDKLSWKSKKKLSVKEKIQAKFKKIKKFYGYKDYNLLDIYNICKEYCPETNRNHWVDIIINKINSYKGQSNLFIITDCRFKSEIKEIRKNFDYMEVTTVRVIRNDCKKIVDISESELDSVDADYVIENNLSLEDYKSRIKEFLSLIQ